MVYKFLATHVHILTRDFVGKLSVIPTESPHKQFATNRQTCEVICLVVADGKVISPCARLPLDQHYLESPENGSAKLLNEKSDTRQTFMRGVDYGSSCFIDHVIWEFLQLKLFSSLILVYT